MIPLYIIIFVPMLLGALGFFIPKRLFYWSLLIVQAIQVLLSLSIFLHIRAEGAVLLNLGSWPTAIGMALHGDILSTALVLLTSGLFFAYLLYNAKDHYTDNMFMFLFMLIQTVIIALFLTNDLFNVYVLLELSMIIVTILIMYKRGQQSLYDGILFIMINSVGMAFMLFGLGFLYRITGVLDFHALRSAIALIDNKHVLIAPYALIMTGISVKSALFPLFSWLPRAHGAPSAPSVVSAMLSGLLVKVGVFMIIRLQFIFLPAFNTELFFFYIGFLTAVIGFTLALCQNDIKLILAYHTISQVGLIVMGLHAGSEYAYWGAVYHIINHALFKGLLFLTAGAIIEEYGARDYTLIRGVFKRMPFIGIAAAMGVFGITGAPFFNGSVSKYLIQRGLSGDFRELAIYVVNLGTIVSFVKYSSILPSTISRKGLLSIFSIWQKVGLDAATRSSTERKVEEQPQNRTFQNLVSILIGLACLFGGIGGPLMLSFVFQVDLNVDGAFYLSKSLLFLLTFGIGIIIYKLVIIPAKPVLKFIQGKIFTFNDAALMMTLFCVALAAYVFAIS